MQNVEAEEGKYIMAGLLYKDFAAVKGKIYVAACFLVTAAVLLSVLIIPSDEVSDNFIWYGIRIALGIGYFVIISKLEISLMEVDEGRRRKNYILSLPVSKNKYVASKYIFLLIAFYTLMSLGIFLSSMLKINRSGEEILLYADIMSAALPVITGLVMIIPSIEMPFFVGLGVKRGIQMKTGIVIGLFFFIIAYMLFGDLTIFDRISLEGLVEYFMKHRDLTMIVQVVAPYILLGLYYLSYRISCALFARKEWSDD